MIARKSRFAIVGAARFPAVRLDDESLANACCPRLTCAHSSILRGCDDEQGYSSEYD